MLFIYELTILALILVPLFYYRVIKERSWDFTLKELFPYNKNLKKEILGGIKLFFVLLIGFIIISLSITTAEIITGENINDLEKVDEYLDEEITNSILFFLITMSIVVFVEEYFFRSFLIKRIGFFTSTAVFTFFHIGYGSIAQIIGVFFLGLILAYWFEKHKSIIQNYLGHMFYNLLAIFLYFIF
jgi:membrane protease YdiL (CAAX protease family)